MTEPTLLPNLFVIGAPKAGTTSLHHYLGLHPSISMSSEKEPRLFAAPDYPESLRRYCDLFPENPGEVRGESTAIYSQHPHWPGIAARIHDQAPRARLVYLVRDPVERALAHYRQRVAAGTEKRPPSLVFQEVTSPRHPYLAPSRYATQLDQYLAFFPRDRILVVDGLDLELRRRDTMRTVFEFIGVDGSFESAEFDRRLNTKDDLRLPTRSGRVARATGLSRLARRVLPQGARRRLRVLTSRPTADVELAADVRASLEDALRPEANRLRELSGLSLGHWTV